MGDMGWIEIVLFYGIAIGFGLWQWVKMDRMLKKTRAERAEIRGRAERAASRLPVERKLRRIEWSAQGHRRKKRNIQESSPMFGRPNSRSQPQVRNALTALDYSFPRAFLMRMAV